MKKKSKETGTKAVYNLSYRFFNTFRCIAIDSYFKSIQLAKIPFENKISLIGTLKKIIMKYLNHFWPQKFKKFLVAYLY